jgi:hypothetical protein
MEPTRSFQGVRLPNHRIVMYRVIDAADWRDASIVENIGLCDVTCIKTKDSPPMNDRVERESSPSRAASPRAILARLAYRFESFDATVKRGLAVAPSPRALLDTFVHRPAAGPSACSHSFRRWRRTCTVAGFVRIHVVLPPGGPRLM